ncbi:MAG: hypothetical protein MZW92_72295 [Comamonadaceae bacterium]|nr:hypothetical protein [Comamonadaceae bacterium]
MVVITEYYTATAATARCKSIAQALAPPATPPTSSPGLARVDEVDRAAGAGGLRRHPGLPTALRRPVRHRRRRHRRCCR